MRSRAPPPALTTAPAAPRAGPAASSSCSPASPPPSAFASSAPSPTSPPSPSSDRTELDHAPPRSPQAVQAVRISLGVRFLEAPAADPLDAGGGAARRGLPRLGAEADRA